MHSIKVRDKTFTLYIKAEEIDRAVSRLAREISRDLGDKNPLFLVILNGAFVFAADLLRKTGMDCELSFVKLASYAGTQSTGSIRELIGLNESVAGRSVVIIEDIIDTGVTVDDIIGKARALGAREVKVAALLFKPGAFLRDYRIDYVGMEIPNDFIVGYGLDYNGGGRNLPDIYRIVEENPPA